MTRWWHLASETSGSDVVVDVVEDAHCDGARDEDDDQPHPPTTIVEEVHTVAASETTGTDVVVDGVDDAHRDGVRDEDDEQPHPPIISAEEFDTVAASKQDIGYRCRG